MDDDEKEHEGIAQCGFSFCTPYEIRPHFVS